MSQLTAAETAECQDDEISSLTEPKVLLSSFLLHFNPQNTLSLINPYSHMLLFNPQWFLTQESHPHTQMDT